MDSISPTTSRMAEIASSRRPISGDICSGAFSTTFSNPLQALNKRSSAPLFAVMLSLADWKACKIASIPIRSCFFSDRVSASPTCGFKRSRSSIDVFRYSISSSVRAILASRSASSLRVSCQARHAVSSALSSSVICA